MRVLIFGILGAAALVTVIFFGRSVFEIGALFGFFDGRYEWRQKTTIIVGTPTGEISASSVARVKGRVGRGRGLDQFGASASVVEGEATALEVSPGRWLYMTLHQGNEADRLRFALEDRLGLMNSTEVTQKLPSMVGEPFTLLPDRVTRLITFDDPRDARTASEVDLDEFARTFGQGYAIVDVTLEIVRDKVTQGGLGPASDWIDQYPGRLPIKPHQVENPLNGSEFKRVIR